MNFSVWLEAKERQVYYHVTYYKNLDGISNRGLIKGARPNFTGRMDLAQHSGKGLFLASSEVSHWVDVLENWAEHNSDNIKKDGLIPIILRVRAFPDLAKVDDYPGNPKDAWIYPKNIRQEHLEMWDGTKWTPQISRRGINLGLFIEEEGKGDDYWFSFRPYPYPPDLRR